MQNGGKALHVYAGEGRQNAPPLAAAGRMVYTVNGVEVGSVELRYAQTVRRDIFPENRTLLQRILSGIFGTTVTVSGSGVGLI